MATARSQQVDLTATPYYHCVSRCVRRAYLYGKDFATGKDYSHRKQWLVDRIKSLSESFSISIAAYAVMSNHYHLVIHVDSEVPYAWDDDEVAKRWGKIFSHDASSLKDMPSKAMISKKISTWRSRLCSISWFMRCLNENIARLANYEDECTGRFWEGRFKSQALLDEGALLAAMAYVDLNPVRAGIADSPENSEFTSIHERSKHLKQHTKPIKTKLISETAKNKSSQTHSHTQFAKVCDSSPQPAGLMTISTVSSNNAAATPSININLSEYLNLVDETGRMMGSKKRGCISYELKPILTRLNLQDNAWLDIIKNLEKSFAHAIGHVDNLVKFGKKFHDRALKGKGAAKKYYLTSSA